MSGDALVVDLNLARVQRLNDPSVIVNDVRVWVDPETKEVHSFFIGSTKYDSEIVDSVGADIALAAAAFEALKRTSVDAAVDWIRCVAEQHRGHGAERSKA